MSSRDPTDPPEYRFDDIRVDTRAHRVFRGDVEVQLEPKAYAVLLALLREPHVAIERNRLLDSVWGHRFVTPAVLNRVIAMLRRSFGDDADHPHLIRTVHGVGYSFIGLPAGSRWQHDNAGKEAADPSDESTEEAATGHPDNQSRSGAQSAKDEAETTGTERWPRIVIVSGVLLAIAIAVLSWRFHHGSSTESVAPSPNIKARLALLPIVPETSADTVLARGLTDMLAEALARVPEFEPTELESARVAVEREADPMAISTLLGTEYLLRGRLAQQGERVSLELELLRGSDGTAEWKQEYNEPRATLAAILGPVLAALQVELLPGTTRGRLDPVIRASATAQALYLESKTLANLDSAGRAENLRLLERAVAEDPEFALGWAALASARRHQYSFGEAGFQEAMEGAQQAVDRALEIDPDLVDALVVACTIKTNQWRASAALGASLRALELAPNDPRAVWARANVLGYLGRPRESLALRRRAVALNPLMWGPIWSMSTDYLMLGQRDQALETLQAAINLRGVTHSSAGMRTRIEQAFGNPAAAVLDYRRGQSTDKAYILYLPLAAAQALAAMGETAEAQSLFDSTRPALPEAPVYVDTLLTVFWSAGRFKDALAWLEGPGREAAQAPWQTVARAHARALTGDVNGALADYASALEGPADRELIFNSWFPTRFGPPQLANWIALRKARGLDYRAELDDLSTRLDRAESAGLRVPAINYHWALLAALRDDPTGADAALTKARESGWFDPLALDVDQVWLPFRHSDWFLRQRQALADKAARQSRALAAGISELGPRT